MEQSPLKNSTLAFFGTPDIAVPVLEALHASGAHLSFVVTQPDSRDPKTKKPVVPPVKTTAESFGIPVLQPQSPSDPVCQEAFTHTTLDAVILFAYGSIIPGNVLDIPKKGWVNVHPSLLPKFRGASPIQFAILSGDVETGVSLIRMDQGLDTGPIIAQQHQPIEPDDTSATLGKKLSRLASDMIVPVLTEYLNDKIQIVPQKEAVATYTRRFAKQDGEIDWTDPAETIERQIRAFTPWPGTFTHLDNLRIAIKTAKIHQHKGLNPGQILVENESLLVGCGKNTALQIMSLQRAGKKEQHPTEFLRGFQNLTGKRFS